MIRVKSNGANRSGVIYVQSLLVVFVMSLLTVGILQWAFVIAGHQAVNAATGEGARVASRQSFAGGTQQSVTENAVRGILMANGMDASKASVTIVDGADSVSVSVSMKFSDANVPDWLAAFGFSMANHRYQAGAIGWK